MIANEQSGAGMEGPAMGTANIHSIPRRPDDGFVIAISPRWRVYEALREGEPNVAIERKWRET
jgi:hypothetical protein